MPGTRTAELTSGRPFSRTAVVVIVGLWLGLAALAAVLIVRVVQKPAMEV